MQLEEGTRAVWNRKCGWMELGRSSTGRARERKEKARARVGRRGVKSGMAACKIYTQRPKARFLWLSPAADLSVSGPHTGKALVVCNGAYGRRIVQMLKYMNRAHTAIDLDEKYVHAYEPRSGSRPLPRNRGADGGRRRRCGKQCAADGGAGRRRPARGPGDHARVHHSLRDDDGHPQPDRGGVLCVRAARTTGPTHRVIHPPRPVRFSRSARWCRSTASGTSSTPCRRSARSRSRPRRSSLTP